MDGPRNALTNSGKVFEANKNVILANLIPCEDTYHSFLKFNVLQQSTVEEIQKIPNRLDKNARIYEHAVQTHVTTDRFCNALIYCGHTMLADHLRSEGKNDVLFNVNDIEKQFKQIEFFVPNKILRLELYEYLTEKLKEFSTRIAWKEHPKEKETLAEQSKAKVEEKLQLTSVIGKQEDQIKQLTAKLSEANETCDHKMIELQKFKQDCRGLEARYKEEMRIHAQYTTASENTLQRMSTKQREFDEYSTAIFYRIHTYLQEAAVREGKEDEYKKATEEACGYMINYMDKSKYMLEQLFGRFAELEGMRKSFAELTDDVQLIMIRFGMIYDKGTFGRDFHEFLDALEDKIYQLYTQLSEQQHDTDILLELNSEFYQDIQDLQDQLNSLNMTNAANSRRLIQLQKQRKRRDSTISDINESFIMVGKTTKVTRHDDVRVEKVISSNTINLSKQFDGDLRHLFTQPRKPKEYAFGVDAYTQEQELKPKTVYKPSERGLSELESKTKPEQAVKPLSHRVIEAAYDVSTGDPNKRTQNSIMEKHHQPASTRRPSKKTKEIVAVEDKTQLPVTLVGNNTEDEPLKLVDPGSKTPVTAKLFTATDVFPGKHHVHPKSDKQPAHEIAKTPKAMKPTTKEQGNVDKNIDILFDVESLDIDSESRIQKGKIKANTLTTAIYQHRNVDRDLLDTTVSGKKPPINIGVFEDDENSTDATVNTNSIQLSEEAVITTTQPKVALKPLKHTQQLRIAGVLGGSVQAGVKGVDEAKKDAKTYKVKSVGTTQYVKTGERLLMVSKFSAGRSPVHITTEKASEDDLKLISRDSKTSSVRSPHDQSEDELQFSESRSSISEDESEGLGRRGEGTSQPLVPPPTPSSARVTIRNYHPDIPIGYIPKPTETATENRNAASDRLASVKQVDKYGPNEVLVIEIEDDDYSRRSQFKVQTLLLKSDLAEIHVSQVYKSVIHKILKALEDFTISEIKEFFGSSGENDHLGEHLPTVRVNKQEFQHLLGSGRIERAIMSHDLSVQFENNKVPFLTTPNQMSKYVAKQRRKWLRGSSRAADAPFQKNSRRRLADLVKLKPKEDKDAGIYVMSSRIRAILSLNVSSIDPGKLSYTKDRMVIPNLNELKLFLKNLKESKTPDKALQEILENVIGSLENDTAVRAKVFTRAEIFTTVQLRPVEYAMLQYIQPLGLFQLDSNTAKGLLNYTDLEQQFNTMKLAPGESKVHLYRYMQGGHGNVDDKGKILLNDELNRLRKIEKSYDFSRKLYMTISKHVRRDGQSKNNTNMNNKQTKSTGKKKQCEGGENSEEETPKDDSSSREWARAPVKKTDHAMLKNVLPPISGGSHKRRDCSSRIGYSDLKALLVEQTIGNRSNCNNTCRDARARKGRQGEEVRSTQSFRLPHGRHQYLAKSVLGQVNKLPTIAKDVPVVRRAYQPWLGAA